MAPICDHCGFNRGDVSEEDLQRFRDRRLRTKIYRLNMFSYAVMTVVVLTFGWYYLATGGLQQPVSTNGPYMVMMVSAVAYLVVRILLFSARREKKKNRAN